LIYQLMKILFLSVLCVIIWLSIVSIRLGSFVIQGVALLHFRLKRLIVSLALRKARAASSSPARTCSNAIRSSGCKSSEFRPSERRWPGRSLASLGSVGTRVRATRRGAGARTTDATDAGKGRAAAPPAQALRQSRPGSLETVSVGMMISLTRLHAQKSAEIRKAI
jgi:hypothetical protein